MSAELLSLIAGLAGAIIGAAASIVTVIVQSRIQDRRERVRQCTDLAIEDYKLQLQLSERFGTKGGKIPPVTLFVDYHIRLAKELEKGALTPEAYGRIVGENELLLRKIEELNTPPRSAAS